MKRARIKGMVSVPARRKAVQDTPAQPVAPIEKESANENKESIVSDLCPSSEKSVEKTAESNPQEKVIQEEAIVLHQLPEEQLCINKSSIQTNDRSETTKEILRETVQERDAKSPSKAIQGRSCFTKPVPRLDSGGRIRRNSIQGSGASASESEDDTRRTNVTNNRIRNDSVCSVQSTRETNVSVNKNNVARTKLGPKRRMLVSESARKLAEARREFHLRHENKAPDRSKLTMYDLIYYNPTTNPMKCKNAAPVARKASICLTEEEKKEEEEDADDPASAMPVPQVKVGPDGELIIDEQSLVIEQTDAKKNREVLAKEAIVDDENNGGGFYKRRQKSKEWPKWETLKFYKALNTVGTDFLLMQSLFPKRTRQEIKIKFKKEEKVNRHLVEKALAYHQEFDIDILEKSLATFEESEKEHTSMQNKPKRDVKEKKQIKAEKKRKSSIVAISIAQMDGSDDDDDDLASDVLAAADQDTETNNNRSQELSSDEDTKPICKKPREEKDKPEDVAVEAEDVESLSSNHSGSDTEIYHVRPTRSGRIPKVKKLQAPDVNTLDNNSSYEDKMEGENLDSSDNTHAVHYTDTIKTAIPNISQVEPGSLVILSKESPEEPGQSVLQVYMVSSNINAPNDQSKPKITPVDLSPELLATVTTRLSDIEPISVKKECE